MWKLRPETLDAAPLRVAVIGCGGTGSEVLSNLIGLHHELQANGYGGLHVVAFDPDVVTMPNVVRAGARFATSDVGRNKAVVVVDRLNLWGMTWEAVPHTFSADSARRSWDIVLSCIDTRKGRRQLHTWAFGKGLYCWKLWLDCGNDLWTGQAVLGTPRSEQLVHHLPCASELHPELIDPTLDTDTTPSCSAIEALSRQSLFINKMVATLAVDMLSQLFRFGELEYHARYVDIRSNRLGARHVPPPRPRKRATSARAPQPPPAAPRDRCTSTQQTGRRHNRKRH